MIGIAMIVALFSAGGANADLSVIYLVYIFLGGTFVAGHAMVLNDILDFEIDKINAPKRSLPSGRMSLNEAKLFCIILALLGTLFFYLADLEIDRLFTPIYGLFHILLSDIYSWKLKKTGLLGNFIVAYMSYAAFLYGDLIVNNGLTAIVQGLGIAAFLLSLSRELIKGLMDIEGDSEYGVKTLAVVLGVGKTSRVALFLHTMVMGLFFYPIFAESGSIGKFGAVLAFAFMSYLISSNSANYTVSNAKSVKNMLLLPPLIIAPFIILDTLV